MKFTVIKIIVIGIEHYLSWPNPNFILLNFYLLQVFKASCQGYAKCITIHLNTIQPIIFLQNLTKYSYFY